MPFLRNRRYPGSGLDPNGPSHGGAAMVRFNPQAAPSRRSEFLALSPQLLADGANADLLGRIKLCYGADRAAASSVNAAGVPLCVPTCICCRRRPTTTSARRGDLLRLGLETAFFACRAPTRTSSRERPRSGSPTGLRVGGMRRLRRRPVQRGCTVVLSHLIATMRRARSGHPSCCL